MKPQSLVSPSKEAKLHASHGVFHLTLVVRLGGVFTGRDVVQFSPDATVSLVGTDELSSSYNRTNWASGLASGALFAFRALRAQRQYVVVSELTGRLRAEDMDVIADSVAHLVARLLGKGLPSALPEGWDVQFDVTVDSELESTVAKPAPTPNAAETNSAPV